jgi:hypothetical protein
VRCNEGLRGTMFNMNIEPDAESEFIILIAANLKDSDSLVRYSVTLRDILHIVCRLMQSHSKVATRNSNINTSTKTSATLNSAPQR